MDEYDPTILRLDKSNPKTFEFSFGKLTCFPRHAQGEFKPGIDFGKKETDLVLQTLNGHFKGQPCAYVSLREESYSVNPVMARALFNGTILKRAAFVLHGTAGFAAFESERVFYKIPVKAFTTLSEAEAFILEGMSE